jgi:opacity protein-like surface antigen
MRRLLLAAVMLGAAAGAQAADLSDLPILRGAFTEGLSTAKVNWQGYYVGGQAGYGSSDEDFGRFPSTRPLTAALLAGTPIQSQMGVSSWAPSANSGRLSSRAWGGGAFAGYNSQWDDVVIGLEASYLHGGFGGSLTAADTRSSTSPLSDGYYHQVTATSHAAISIKDMATFRGRAGYAFGCFLPYLFGGVALGNADITRTATVLDVTTPGLAIPTPPPQAPVFGSATVAQHNHLIYGYSAGLGVDVNLIGGLFLRAEWEYIRFTAAVDTNINTVRAGLGYKF